MNLSDVCNNCMLRKEFTKNFQKSYELCVSQKPNLSTSCSNCCRILDFLFQLQNLPLQYKAIRKIRFCAFLLSILFLVNAFIPRNKEEISFHSELWTSLFVNWKQYSGSRNRKTVALFPPIFRWSIWQPPRECPTTCKNTWDLSDQGEKNTFYSQKTICMNACTILYFTTTFQSRVLLPSIARS